ncbi:MAG: serine/threonine protein kinase [Myxococcales bacterium]|nr:serine/threonine protein kinase [Myxococcales bacterium]
MGDSDRDERASAPTVAHGRGPGSDRPKDVEHDSLPALDSLGSALDSDEARFQAIGELGRGGMGRVDEAFDRVLGRPVAVKRMLSSSAVDLARFEREARVTARLEHPGIVPIHDAGRDADGTLFYVMRRIDGRPLDELVDGTSFEERLALVPNVLAACDAVAFAHARKVIHRDIKPTNILIGPFGETLIIDWGLARTIGDAADGEGGPVSDPSLTRAGMVAGTPGFMAPEQARGETVDERADVFALGATLFYVIAGQLPFAASSATEMIDHVGADRPPDWRRLPEATPADLRAIVQKALASKRDQRYADAGALAADLRRFVTGKLVGAYRYGRLEQLWRFVRRHRAAVAVATIAVIVIALGAVLSFQRIVTERDAANHSRELADLQRSEATAKSDQLLVEHALQLAATDAVSAIASLRQLSPSSSQWERAATVAAAASVRGVPFGFTTSPAFAALDIAPDSRRLIVKSWNEPEVTLVDLDARTRRLLVKLPDCNTTRWIDDRWLICTGPNQLYFFDTTTGVTRTAHVDSEIQSVHTDRAGHAWVLTSAGTVHPASPDGGGLGPPISTGVSRLFAVGTGRLVIAREAHLERWSDAGTEVIPGSEGIDSGLTQAGYGHIAGTVGTKICEWDLRDVVELVGCGPASPSGVTIAIGPQVRFEYGLDGLEMIGRTGRAFVRRTGIGSISPTLQGLVLATTNGALELFDRQGWTVIGGRPVSYRRIVESDDERFVAAVTAQGELLVWDLSQFRPRSTPIFAGESLFGVGPQAVWTNDLAGPIYRYDRATGAREQLFDATLTSVRIDRSLQWILGESEPHHVVALYDMLHHTLLLQPWDSVISVGPVGALVVTGAGAAHRVDGTTLGAKLGTFPAQPIGMAVGATEIVVAVKGGQVCRMPVEGGSPSCIDVPEPTDLAVDDSGRAWFVVRGRLSRWERTGELVGVEMPQAIRSLVWSGSKLVAIAATSFAVLDTSAPRAISVRPMQSMSGGTSERLIGILPQGGAAAIDLRTGITFELPLPGGVMTGSLVSDGTTVAGILTDVDRSAKRDIVVLWEFRTPTEAAALQRWLATVTNATLVPDSDVVAWP